MRVLPPLLVCLLPLAACQPAPRVAARPAVAAAPSETIPACPANATVMDGWDERAPPRRIFGNTFYIGTCGITSILIAGNQGVIVIDGATEKAAVPIEANIRALGFKLGDVRYLLNTHEHSDHAGGLAQLQRDTGAPLLALAVAATTLRSGKGNPADPQFEDMHPYPPVADVRVITDGHVVQLGDLRLTAHATPGHAPGGTSWTWRSCEGTHCVDIVYADSFSTPTDAHHRRSDDPAAIAAFRHSLDLVASLPCDILLTPHPLRSNLPSRLDGKAPMINPAACKAYAEQGRVGLDAKIAEEQGRKSP